MSDDSHQYPDTQLLCTFTNRSRLPRTLKNIEAHYQIPQDRIFVLSDAGNPNKLFCTFNAETEPRRRDFLRDTISIHRNRSSSTLYTINALNAVIQRLNGELDESYEVPWHNYENTLLVTDSGKLKEVPTKLVNIHTL